MLGSDVKQSEAAETDFECVVFDVHARRPGFYRASWRTYYVARSGGVYLVRAPGQRVTLREEDDLPSGAEPAPAEAQDVALHHLAAAVEAVTRQPAGAEGRS